ncbi:HK97 family phage prohead protease [Paratractidigestivibacter sp.]|uniref:HK97 family phage prohead protease n=1 Tax=Paratractidigestivibacter sp. TaxID=2847316 RepID=UPI002AC96F90|nr:HK97 family phage prohead protease [Paratractidigestivibacter sp.]
MKNKIQFRTFAGALVRSAEEEESGKGRKFTFVASDASRDSSGTVLNQAGWALDRFNANPVIGYQHKVYGGSSDTDDPDNIIGKGRAYVEDGKLMVDVELEPEGDNPLADKVCRKLHFGSLNAVSVGFVPTGKSRWGEAEEAADGSTPTLYFEGQELLEISVVNIPANPNALRKEIEVEDDEDEEKKPEESGEKDLEDEDKKPGEGEEGDSAEDDEDEEKDEEETERSLTIAEATLLYL